MLQADGIAVIPADWELRRTRRPRSRSRCCAAAWRRTPSVRRRELFRAAWARALGDLAPHRAPRRDGASSSAASTSPLPDPALAPLARDHRRRPGSLLLALEASHSRALGLPGPRRRHRPARGRAGAPRRPRRQRAALATLGRARARRGREPPAPRRCASGRSVTAASSIESRGIHGPAAPGRLSDGSSSTCGCRSPIGATSGAPTACPTDAARGTGEQPLSIAEIDRLVRAFAALGVWKVRLTGGEPTMRRDISDDRPRRSRPCRACAASGSRRTATGSRRSRASCAKRALRRST